jgi:pSer/pThr/pTyr-binding forkhead associated (FHA) protein/S1-C subfamily serine protease
MDNAGKAPQLTLPDGHTVSLVGRMRLGRGSHTDIPLDDSTASREHAAIEVTADGVVLSDLGSSNGTFVNEVKLTGPRLLQDGDSIRIGHSTLTFHRPQTIQAATAELPLPVAEGATLMWETQEPLCLVRADGQRFAVTHSLRLGRDPGCDLVLDDRSASHQHARIDLVAGQASVIDLGSSNGTWVNGQRISAPHPLKHGDHLQVGDTLFTFQIEGHPLPAGRVEAAPVRRQSLSLGLLLGGGSLLLILGFLFVVVLGLGAVVLSKREGATPTPRVEATLTAELAMPTAPSQSAAERRQRALRAAVIVFTPVEGEQDKYSTGSGSLLTAAGYILTNFHVIGDVDKGEYYNQEGRAFIGLNWDDPEGAPNTFYQAEIAQADQDLDLALLHVIATKDGDALPADLKFPTLPVGDSDMVAIGDELVAIGFPGLGGETVTLTRGTVSGFLTDEAGRSRGWIKTDAEINPGNSGGMAINDQGELIGVPTIVVSGKQVTGKIGVIRPINLARTIIDQAR